MQYLLILLLLAGNIVEKQVLCALFCFFYPHIHRFIHILCWEM